jgi:hypothetical protein
MTKLKQVVHCTPEAKDIGWTRNRWEAKAKTGDFPCPDDYLI